MGMKGEGYIFIKDKAMHRCARIYMSIQELRLCCGEVDAKDIARAGWRIIENDDQKLS